MIDVQQKNIKEKDEEVLPHQDESLISQYHMWSFSFSLV